jgi:RHS repeat-associated protein
VSTSIAKQGSTIYGNVAATVVVQVDPTSPYGPDPGHPGFGTIAAVIQDGAGLFPKGPRPASAKGAASSPGSQDITTTATGAPAASQQPAPAAIAAGNRRFFFYSPELHLLAESELTTSASPAVLTDYIWFSGHPVAQAETSGTTSWTFTDHLGTPILQTSAAQGVAWRAEYEPYGLVFGLRSADQHQPLRLPGQETEQLGAGANGVTSRTYNIYRWYEPALERYSQADPIDRVAGVTTTYQYNYSFDNPARYSDRLGLQAMPMPMPSPAAPPFKLVPPPPCAIPKPPPAVAPWVAALSAWLTVFIDEFFIDTPGLGETPEELEAVNPSSCRSCKDNSDLCQRLMVLCLTNPWQPEWNRRGFGPHKDCGACFRQCRHDGGAWPFEKCPLP